MQVSQVPVIAVHETKRDKNLLADALIVAFLALP